LGLEAVEAEENTKKEMMDNADHCLTCSKTIWFC